MHQDEWTPCPVCGDEERPDEECWQCRGSGLMDPDGVVAEPEPKPAGFPSCPKCDTPMARRSADGSIWCRRCNGYVRPFDEADVLRDPSILET